MWTHVGRCLSLKKTRAGPNHIVSRSYKQEHAPTDKGSPSRGGFAKRRDSPSQPGLRAGALDAGRCGSRVWRVFRVSRSSARSIRVCAALLPINVSRTMVLPPPSWCRYSDGAHPHRRLRGGSDGGSGAAERHACPTRGRRHATPRSYCPARDTPMDEAAGDVSLRRRDDASRLSDHVPRRARHTLHASAPGGPDD